MAKVYFGSGRINLLTTEESHRKNGLNHLLRSNDKFNDKEVEAFINWDGFLVLIKMWIY